MGRFFIGLIHVTQSICSVPPSIRVQCCLFQVGRPRSYGQAFLMTACQQVASVPWRCQEGFLKSLTGSPPCFTLPFAQLEQPCLWGWSLHCRKVRACRASFLQDKQNLNVVGLWKTLWFLRSCLHETYSCGLPEFYFVLKTSGVLNPCLPGVQLGTFDPSVWTKRDRKPYMPKNERARRS